MPYVAREDIGTTQRRSLSGRRRLQAWERTGGECVVCGLNIDGVRERWIVEHIRALELGGADELQNMGPAHESCGREKTRDDHTRAARAKRQKIRHLGAVVITRPLPGSRTSALKRKVNGIVVPRNASVNGGARHEVRIGRERNAWKRSKFYSPNVAVDACVHLSDYPTRALEIIESATGSFMTDQKPPIRVREKIKSEQNDSSPERAKASRPQSFDFALEGRPLLPGEDASQYDLIRENFVQQVKPADVIEAIWLKDMIDHTWEAKRLRRLRNQILIQGRMKAVAELILPAFQQENSAYIEGVTGPSVDTLAAGWASGNQRSTELVNKYLQKRNLGIEDITAHAFLLSLSAIERIDRLISLVEHRRDVLIREMERKRANFAPRVRAAADLLEVEHEPSS